MQKINQGWVFKVSIPFAGRVSEITGEAFELGKSADWKSFLKEEIPNLPFIPYRHQLALFRGAVSSDFHLGISATGSGKSLAIYLMMKYYLKQNKKILFLCPSISLTTQMRDDCISYNAPGGFVENIQLLGGDFTRNDIDQSKKMLFSTWQSACKVDLSGFDVVVNDETHRAKAEVLQTILKNNFKIKIGVTGTMPISELDHLLLEQQFGSPVRYINAREMIDNGMATDVTIMPMFLDHGRIKAMKYHDEVKFMKESLPRREFVVKLLHKLTGVTVGIYQHTAHGIQTWEDLAGEKLTPKIKKSFIAQKELGVFFIAGETPPKIRDAIRHYLSDTHDKVILIAQKNILSTGVNIKALKNLVFLAPNKSFTDTIQSIGRVLRLHTTKQKAVVIDLVDEMSAHRKTNNYLLDHFFERLSYYESEEFQIKEVEIKLPK